METQVQGVENVKQRKAPRNRLSHAQLERLRQIVLEDYKTGRINVPYYDKVRAKAINEEGLLPGKTIERVHVLASRTKLHIHCVGKKPVLYRRRWERQPKDVVAEIKKVVAQTPTNAISHKGLRGQVDKAGKRRLLTEIIARLEALRAVI